MDDLVRYLNHLAVDFCELHDVSCCTRECYKHSHYQCKHNSDPIISSYWKSRLLCHDIEQVEKYIAYIGIHELDSLIDVKVQTSKEARMIKCDVYVILQIFKNKFSGNTYVIKYNSCCHRKY
jgi:hypothetical protein